MEPAVHVGVGLVVQCPLGAIGCADIDGDKIHCQHSRQRQEADDTTGLGAAGKFIGQHQAGEHQHETQQLIAGSLAVELE